MLKSLAILTAGCLISSVALAQNDWGPLPRIVKNAVGQNCNGIYRQCARVFGDIGQDFFLIDVAKYNRVGTDNYKYSEVQNALIASKLFRMDGVRHKVMSKDGAIVKLGVPGEEYYLVPICKDGSGHERAPVRDNKQPLLSPEGGEFLIEARCMNR